MKSKIREHRGVRVAGGETEPYLPPVPLYMPEAGWSEWLARLARNVNVLGQNTGTVSNSGGSTVTTDDVPPAAPADGDMWWDSVGGQLYVWYDDPSGDPGQWVVAINQPGPAGPQGPPGTPGGSATLFDYNYNTTITAPPGSGQVRLNNANQTLATVIWISDFTSPGVDVGPILQVAITATSRLVLQDKDDSTRYQRYQVSGTPTFTSGYMQVPVAWTDGGSALPSGQRIVLAVVVEGEAGPPGPAGPPGVSIAVGDAPPAPPVDNQLWWESDTGALWVRFNDGTSSQWVATSGPTGLPGPTGATGPGVPVGGTAGQVLSKIDAANYNTQWSTAAGGSIGVTDGSNAAAGHIGEYQTAQRPSATAVTLTTGVNADLVTLTLTAGDWDVWGSVFISAGANVLSLAMGWLSTVSVTSPAPPDPAYHQLYSATGFLQQLFMPVGHTRISSATTVTVYLSALTYFATGSVDAYGVICARRVR